MAPSAELEHRDVLVRVDADLAGDLEALSHDVARGERAVLRQGAGRGEGVGAAGADRENPVVGLDDLAVAADDEAVVPVDDDEHRLEAAQHAVAAPLLRELDGRAREVAGVALELLL